MGLGCAADEYRKLERLCRQTPGLIDYAELLRP